MRGMFAPRPPALSSDKRAPRSGPDRDGSLWIWVRGFCYAGRMSTARTAKVPQHELALRDHAMTYPEVHEDFPWGHRAMKVRGKAFAFLGNASHGQQDMSVSLKLRASHETALLFPFVEPTGYGMGKSGWVTATFAPGEEPPMPILKSWIDESYRLIAPKRLVATLPPLADADEEAPRRAASRAAKPAAKAPAKKAEAPAKAAKPASAANKTKAPAKAAKTATAKKTKAPAKAAKPAGAAKKKAPAKVAGARRAGSGRAGSSVSPSTR
jgi:predicted DNA-binding protein (MmcQ/YjbR family)